jgi:hypothetical protein
MKSLKIAVFVIVLCVTLTACFPPTPAPAPTPTPLLSTSEEFVTAAWNAYNQNDFAKAIELALECIKRWESDATKQQAALTQAPPNGKVSDDEKKEIFANWALNDVGTAYFIKALSLEKSGKIADAKDAYNMVITFPYARCWDPKGWFWSPAEVASENLAKLP